MKKSNTTGVALKRNTIIFNNIRCFINVEYITRLFLTKTPKFNYLSRLLATTVGIFMEKISFGWPLVYSCAAPMPFVKSVGVEANKVCYYD